MIQQILNTDYLFQIFEFRKQKQHTIIKNKNDKIQNPKKRKRKCCTWLEKGIPGEVTAAGLPPELKVVGVRATVLPALKTVTDEGTIRRVVKWVRRVVNPAPLVKNTRIIVVPLLRLLPPGKTVSTAENNLQKYKKDYAAAEPAGG